MSNADDLAHYLGTTTKALTYHLYISKPKDRYTEFKIPKKDGSYRIISAPNSTLKEYQKRICVLLDSIYRPKPSVHGFLKNRSIATNAIQHVNSRFVLNLDLQNFFPSITFPRVRGLLMNKPYNFTDAVATLIAQMVTNKNGLPQGAPSSPVISNLICSKLDSQLQNLAKKNRCIYTRYADDITFSSRRLKFPEEIARLIPSGKYPTVELGREIVDIIETNGFLVNYKKTRMRSLNNRQVVTGLTVNKILNVNKKLIRQIRAMLHAWEKYGLANAEMEFQTKYYSKHRHPNKTLIKFEDVLFGKINLIRMVRGKNNPYVLKYLKKLKELGCTKNFTIADPHLILKESLWVIESEKTQSQGTGFMLKDVGLVSCAHLFYESIAGGFNQAISDDFIAYQPHKLSTKYAIKLKAINRHFDISISEINVENPHSLDIASKLEVDYYDDVLLAGFPQFSIGDNETRKYAQVTKVSIKSLVELIGINQSIVSGNSGGPLLNSNNEVIGIAAYGSEDSQTAERTSRHQCINIKHLKTAMEKSDEIIIKSPDKTEPIKKAKSEDKSIIQINLKLHHFYTFLILLVLIIYLTH
jgi:RNA-directed DNA polymerase